LVEGFGVAAGFAGGLFPRKPPEGFPVVLGAFFSPLDFAII